MNIIAGIITQYDDLGTGAVLQNVPWSIVEKGGETEGEETVLLSGNQSFQLTATAEEIRDFLTRRLQVYKDDVAGYERATVLREGLDNAAEVANEVSGITINDE